MTTPICGQRVVRFGSGGVLTSRWRSAKARVHNPDDHSIDWSWDSSNGFPDQFERDRVVVLDYTSDSGYSDWTQREDGTIIVADYSSADLRTINTGGPQPVLKAFSPDRGGSGAGRVSEAHFDTVIVGAGAAGSVLAARLSRDDRRRLLLIEAGPDFPDGNLPDEIRYGYGRHRDAWALAHGYETRFGWGYRARATRHQPYMFVPRGRIVGGSSAVNALIFLRGVPEDYDGWAELGCPGWGFDEVLPSLRRVETDHDFRDPYHGSDGPIPVRRFPPQELRPEQQAFLDACRDADYDACPDHNAPHSNRVRPAAVQQPRRRPLERRHGLPGPGPRPVQPDHPAGQPGAPAADRARPRDRRHPAGSGRGRGGGADRVRRRDRAGRRRDRYAAPAAPLRHRPGRPPAPGRGAGRLRPARGRRQPA